MYICLSKIQYIFVIDCTHVGIPTAMEISTGRCCCHRCCHCCMSPLFVRLQFSSLGPSCRALGAYYTTVSRCIMSFYAETHNQQQYLYIHTYILMHIHKCTSIYLPLALYYRLDWTNCDHHSHFLSHNIRIHHIHFVLRNQTVSHLIPSPYSYIFIYIHMYLFLLQFCFFISY